MDPRPCLVVLLAAAAVLPIIGFGRLLFRAEATLRRGRAERDRRGTPNFVWSDMAGENPALVEQPKRERNDAVWDIVLVGTGLVSGAVAGVWSLYPTW